MLKTLRKIMHTWYIPWDYLTNNTERFMTSVWLQIGRHVNNLSMNLYYVHLHHQPPSIRCHNARMQSITLSAQPAKYLKSLDEPTISPLAELMSLPFSRTTKWAKASKSRSYRSASLFIKRPRSVGVTFLHVLKASLAALTAISTSAWSPNLLTLLVVYRRGYGIDWRRPIGLDDSRKAFCN